MKSLLPPFQPSDGTWGGLEKDGETWTGIFKDLLDRKIDIATVHMSINSIREEFIDFSVPFMQVCSTLCFIIILIAHLVIMVGAIPSAGYL